MLTINQPAHFGYRLVHDLPTPPSTSRPSPPLIVQEPSQKALPAVPRSRSPSHQPMSAPHRGLPPPAIMTHAQQPPPGLAPPQQPPPPGAPLGQGPPQPHHPQAQAHGQFPPPPSWQQVTEESMRTYLIAKAEEEKRKQEEEKTRQESYRFEQRRLEHDMLRTSLQGGIPPPMIPVVFAGMGGGTLPQAAMDWAQQYLYPQGQQPQPPAPVPAGALPPAHHRRDSQAQPPGHYPGPGVPSTPGSAQGPSSGYVSAYPGSPTRPRGQSMPGPMARPLGGPNPPTLNTNVHPSARGAIGAQSHPIMGSVQQQQEPQPSPTIYFHHWQPPATQAGGSTEGSHRPATPSVESPRKRKATGPQLAAPAPGAAQRLRSPPTQTAHLSTPPRRRRGHSRQKSDLEIYRSAPPRGDSPTHTSGPPPVRESGEPFSSSSSSQQPGQARSAAHSVSSLLADNPPAPQPRHYPPPPPPPPPVSRKMASYDDKARRSPPRLSEDQSRGGAPAT